MRLVIVWLAVGSHQMNENVASIDIHPSPGIRCEKHKDIGISYCNLCEVEMLRARDEAHKYLQDPIAAIADWIREGGGDPANPNSAVWTDDD